MLSVDLSSLCRLLSRVRFRRSRKQLRLPALPEYEIQSHVLGDLPNKKDIERSVFGVFAFGDSVSTTPLSPLSLRVFHGDKSFLDSSPDPFLSPIRESKDQFQLVYPTPAPESEFKPSSMALVGHLQDARSVFSLLSEESIKKAEDRAIAVRKSCDKCIISLFAFLCDIKTQETDDKILIEQIWNEIHKNTATPPPLPPPDHIYSEDIIFLEDMVKLSSKSKIDEFCGAICDRFSTLERHCKSTAVKLSHEMKLTPGHLSRHSLSSQLSPAVSLSDLSPSQPMATLKPVVLQVLSHFNDSTELCAKHSARSVGKFVSFMCNEDAESIDFMDDPSTVTGDDPSSTVSFVLACYTELWWLHTYHRVQILSHMHSICQLLRELSMSYSILASLSLCSLFLE
ncbi:hypothetical protein ADUPG1_000292, partial [Aduncisulcus paluster]